VVVEECQHVVAASVRGAAQLCQFLQYGGHATAQRVDDCAQHGLAATPVGVAVGGDDALVDAPGHRDRQVGIVGEHRGQAGLLAACEQGEAGAQGSAHTVERVAGTAAMTSGLLLDALAGQVQLGAGQGHDMKGIRHRGGLGQHFSGGGLVAAESVHGHHVDLVAERRWLIG
jgi:hypothetical protein